MANICRGRFLFFGKKEDVIALLKEGVYAKETYPLSANASRIAYMSGDYKSPDRSLLKQMKGWMLNASADYPMLRSGEDNLSWTTYNREVSNRMVFKKTPIDEEDHRFFNNWLENQARERRNKIRKNDFQRLIKTEKSSSQMSDEELLEDINNVCVRLLTLMDAPRLAHVDDYDLYRLFRREVLGHRGDISREAHNIWIEYEDEYVLLAITCDYGWWCPIEGTKPVSVMFPDIYFGVVYLEEQGIFGQRLYHNGQEVLKKVGPIGTLPEDSYEVMEESGETWHSLRWEHIIEWQSERVKEAIFSDLGIEPTPLAEHDIQNTEGEEDDA